MPESTARLYLVTPSIADADAFAPLLAEACAAGDVAAVLARLAPSDERSLVKRVKTLAAAAQDVGAALVIAVAGAEDIGALAARGGADGVQVENLADLQDLRRRFKTERIVGAAGIRTRDEAMAFGEAGADYLMFGEPRADGSLPTLQATAERAEWWAEIFETPCVAYAPSLDDVPILAATGAEFVALGDAVWSHPEGPGAAIRQALDALAPQGASR